MRRFASFLGVATAIPVILAVPVLSRPQAAPHPVAPHVTDVSVSALPATRGVVADTGRLVAGHGTTGHFSLVGATWTRGTLAPGASIQVRTHSGGHWSSWSALPLPDGGPDDGSADAKAAAAHGTSATEPLWVGAADGVQAQVVDAAGTRAVAPRALHLVLVDGGASKADASPGPARPFGGAVAEAAQIQPTVYTRAQWGADESLRRSACPKGPDYSSTIKMGFVHHTDGANGYTASQVPSIIRSIYAYHVNANGWCDVGYNFLVDRFGRIWEGRYGGIDKAVIGAHTGGFNTNSFAASLIGSFGSTTPPAAMLTALEKLFAWKLGRYYRDPMGKTTMVAGSFSGSRYAKGTTVTFNVISGHRDADTTTCPGSAAYAKLGAIRTAVRDFIGAGFVAPSISPSSVRMLSGQSVAINAGVLSPQSWTVTVTDAAGVTVKTLTGDTSTSGSGSGVSVGWDGTAVDGTPLPPGTYTVTLTGADAAGSTDLPYSMPVTITPPVTVTGPATASYGAKVTLSGTSAPGSSVTVTLQPATANAAADSRSVTAAPDGTWSTSFTADDDYSWSASTQGWTTPVSKTLVAPEVTTPTLTTARSLFVAKGKSLSVAGTALPGTTVQAVTTPVGGTSSPGPVVDVGADGTWTGVTVTPATAVSMSLRRSDTTTSQPVMVYPVAAPVVTAPGAGYAERAFTVSGDAGHAPLSVQLWTEPAGASSYVLAKTVTAAASGAFTVGTVLPSTSSATSLAWRVVTTDGTTTFGTSGGTVAVQPLFAPTSTGPTGGAYNHALPVTGTAVPGDVVTVWTKPAAGGTWQRAASVTSNASTGAFSTAFTLLRDTLWRVTSPTGTSDARTVVVRPTLSGPHRARSGAMVYLSGSALPGQKVAIYRRSVGTARWHYFTSVTTGSGGRWYRHFRLTHPMNVIVGSHGHWSGVLTIRYA